MRASGCGGGIRSVDARFVLVIPLAMRCTGCAGARVGISAVINAVDSITSTKYLIETTKYPKLAHVWMPEPDAPSCCVRPATSHQWTVAFELLPDVAFPSTDLQKASISQSILQ